MNQGIKQRVIYSARMMHYQHGWGNGYIGVPQGHPWYGKDCTSIEVDVNGGLTYGRLESDGLFWVGFDTCHGWETEESWPKDRVVKETEKLFRQAVDASNEQNKGEEK